jgi:phosphate/sulfate permease
VSLEIVGLAGLVAGAWALRSVQRRARAGTPPPYWGRLRVLAVIAGLCVAIVPFVFSTFLGYPVSGPDGTGRIIGVPFAAAFFDSEGNDFVGPITLVATAANSMFWFMIPQLALAASGWFLARPRATSASDAAA